jgi:hypothetical protein
MHAASFHPRVEAASGPAGAATSDKLPDLPESVTTVSITK